MSTMPVPCPKCGASVSFSLAEIVHSKGSHPCPSCGTQVTLQPSALTVDQAVKAGVSKLKRELEKTARKLRRRR